MIHRPLIPHDVDLRVFRTMPLDVVVLRESGFAARVTDAEFRAGTMLWCAAWHQVPAGSVPDDDFTLAGLAGFGRVVDAWNKVRKGALYNFTDGGNGRLYHSTVCRVAFFDAWLPRLRWLFEAEDDRARKHNKAVKDGRVAGELPRPTQVSFVRKNYPASAAYLDVLDQMTPPLGWTLLLDKRKRERVVLPENLPVPPEPRERPGGSETISAGIPAEAIAPARIPREVGGAFPLENALNGKRKGEETEENTPPNPPCRGAVGSKKSLAEQPQEAGEGRAGPDFAQFLAVGGERWAQMRSDIARKIWAERLDAGVEPALLVACAKVYFAWRDRQDRQANRKGAVVGPATFLRTHWEGNRGDAALLLESEAAAAENAARTDETLAATIAEFGDYAGLVRRAVGQDFEWFAGAHLRLEDNYAVIEAPSKLSLSKISGVPLQMIVMEGVFGGRSVRVEMAKP